MAEEQNKVVKKLTPKDILKIVGLAADVIVTILLLILSIIMIAKINDAKTLPTTGFWGMVRNLMENPSIFLGAVVVPLFILLVLNITLTVFYYQKIAQKEKAEADKAKEEAGKANLNNLTPEQKEALKQELMKELTSKEEKK